MEHAPIRLLCDRPARIATREITSACQTVLDRKIPSVKASSEPLQRFRGTAVVEADRVTCAIASTRMLGTFCCVICKHAADRCIDPGVSAKPRPAEW